MNQEQGLLHEAIRGGESNVEARLIYADWLEDRGDPRADYLRLQLAIKFLPPDHPSRSRIEDQLSGLRSTIDPAWILKVDDVEREVQSRDGTNRCECLPGWDSEMPEAQFHQEPQDTQCDEWQNLLEQVDQAARTGATRFSPFKGWSVEQRSKIKTLPRSIAKLKMVKDLHLYGSHLTRIPPEIGQMESLIKFTPYTSYLLHWFPYEMTHCKKLVDSTVSTRATYGNYKNRMSFPILKQWDESLSDQPEIVRQLESHWQLDVTRPCSVCRRDFEDKQEFRAWLSLGVATDTMPLLVNACSQACLDRLPKPTEDFWSSWHRGGVCANLGSDKTGNRGPDDSTV